MRKLWIALAVVCALAVALPAMAGGATLRQRVNKLEDKLDCLRKTPASTYIGYAYYEGQVGDPGPFPVHDPSTDLLTDASFAAAFDQLFGGPFNPDYWLVVVRDTSSCRSKFDTVANPYTARPAALTSSSASMQRLARLR
jgi:hypothetical protein